MAKSERPLGTQQEATNDPFDLEKVLPAEVKRLAAQFLGESGASSRPWVPAQYTARFQGPEAAAAQLAREEAWRLAQATAQDSQRQAVKDEEVLARRQSWEAPDAPASGPATSRRIPWFENEQLTRQGVDPKYIEAYKAARDDIYDHYGRTTLGEEKLKELRLQFTKKREVQYTVPRVIQTPVGASYVVASGVARNYDPETGRRVPMGQIPQGATITGVKNVGGGEHISPRVKAEIKRHQMQYLGNPTAPIVDGKQKEVRDGIDWKEVGKMAFEGSLANTVLAGPRVLDAIIRNATSDSKESVVDVTTRALGKEWNRLTRPAVAYMNPKTPEEAAYSIGLDGLIAVASFGMGAGATLPKLAATATKFGITKHLVRQGARYLPALGYAARGMHQGVYNPLVRHKGAYTPEEAHKYLEKTYGVYTRHMDDDTVQRLARSMNDVAQDAGFNLNPYGLGGADIHMQAIAYGIDNVANIVGQGATTELEENLDQIKRLAPSLIDTKQDKPDPRGAYFAKDVHDLIATSAEAVAKRRNMPATAQWTEAATTSLLLMPFLIGERKLMGDTAELAINAGLKRIVRDARLVASKQGVRGKAIADIFKTLGGGANNLMHTAITTHAAALMTQNVAIAREGAYLYQKMLDRGMSPGAAFMNSFFTSTMTRGLDRLTEAGLVPTLRVGNALTRNLFRRAGNYVLRVGGGEMMEEQTKDAAMFGIEEMTGKPQDIREQPFRPLMLGGTSQEALDQAVGELVVSLAVGGVMGVGSGALHPKQTMRSAFNTLQHHGMFMGYVNKGLAAQGFTGEQINTMSPIDRMTEYYAGKYKLDDRQKEMLRKVVDMNVSSYGPSALAEMLARNTDAFVRSFGSEENLTAMHDEYQRVKNESWWPTAPEDLRAAVDAVNKHEEANPVTPTTDAPQEGDTPPPATEQPTEDTPVAASTGQTPEETGPVYYRGPRGGLYTVTKSGNKRRVTASKVPEGATIKDASEMPTAGSSAATTPSREGVPMMMTGATKQKLVDLGYTSSEIRSMTPDQALNLIEQAETAADLDDTSFTATDEQGALLPDVRPMPPPPDMVPEDEQYQREGETAGNRIREDEEAAKEMLGRMQKNFPWVQVDLIEGEEKDGTPVLGKSARNAFWVGVDWALGRIETIPHEYAHQFVSWFRNNDLVTRGIEKYGSEEALVDAMGKLAVERQDDGFIVSWAKDFWQTVKEVFGSEADYARKLSRELYRGNALSEQTTFERMAHGGVNLFPNAKTLGNMNVREFLASKDAEAAMFQLDAKHGSRYRFSRFDNEKIGQGAGMQAAGWGLYFTQSDDTAKIYAGKTGGHIYNVRLWPDREHTLLRLEDRISAHPDIVEKVRVQAEKEGLRFPQQDRLDTMVGDEFYHFFAKTMRPRGASEFFYRAGVDGIEFNTLNPGKNGFVVFNDADIQVTAVAPAESMQSQFQHQVAPDLNEKDREIIRKREQARIEAAGDTRSVDEALADIDQQTADEGRTPAPEPRSEGRRTGDTRVFEGSLAESLNPVIGLEMQLASDLGFVVRVPLDPPALMNLLEMPNRAAARDALLAAISEGDPALATDKTLYRAVHRYVARASDRRDFPKVDVNIVIEKPKNGSETVEITQDIHQSKIQRDESGQITAVEFGVYQGRTGSRRVTWEDEPLMVRMAAIGDFFREMGLEVTSGMSAPISRINRVQHTVNEDLSINELGQLASQRPDLYAQVVQQLAQRGIVLIGPPGKNQSFIALNVIPTITPQVYRAFQTTVSNYVAWMDEHKPGWRGTPSGREFAALEARMGAGHVNGQPDLAALNKSLNAHDKMLAVRSAFLAWAMGPEWATTGTKVFKYMNTLATAEQQTIPEFITEAMTSVLEEGTTEEPTAAEQYAASLPRAERSLYERALTDLRTTVEPAKPADEIAKGAPPRTNTKDWDLASLLASKGYVLSSAGMAYKVQDGHVVPGSERYVVALLDHDTYAGGTPFGDGGSLIQPGASIVMDRGHGDPDGDVKFHKVRMFIPSRNGKKAPLLWKGQFDVAAGAIYEAMREMGVAMAVFDSTVKVGKKARAEKKGDGSYRNVADFLRDSNVERVAGTDIFLLNPAEVSKANDATSRDTGSTSMIGQLFFANPVSPVVNPAWEPFYKTMHDFFVNLARRTRAFLGEMHTSEPLLRAFYRDLPTDEAPGDLVRALQELLVADEGEGTPILSMMPHWRPATDSASIRAVLDQMFDFQGSTRVIGQGAFLRADNGSIDGVNIAAIADAFGLEGVKKYCKVDEMIPVDEYLPGGGEMVDKIARQFWLDDKHEEFKADKTSKVLGDMEQEYRAYQDRARAFIARKRGYRQVSIAGKAYWMKGDGRLRETVDGAVPVVLAANKAEKMGVKPGDRILAVAVPTDAPHNAVPGVVVGVSAGVHDWISYASEVVQQLGKDHDGDKLSLYGPSQGYWAREVTRLEKELARAYKTGGDMERIGREIAIAEARARHGFMELSPETFNAMWEHYARDDVRNYMKHLYEKARITGPFGPGAITFIQKHVPEFAFTEPSKQEKEQYEARTGQPWSQPRPYGIFSPLGDAMLMEDYVGQTAELIGYVAGTRNKIEYVTQNLDRIFREQARQTGLPVEEYWAAVSKPDADGFTPLDKIAIVGSLLTHHAVDAPKEDSIFEYKFDSQEYFNWACRQLGVDPPQPKNKPKNFTNLIVDQFKHIREAQTGRIRNSNVYLVDQHEPEGAHASAEARLGSLQAAAVRRTKLRTNGLMDALTAGWGTMPDLSVDAETWNTTIVPVIGRALAEAMGLETVAGVDQHGRSTLLTTDTRVRELTPEEQSSVLGALRQAVRDGDGNAREIAYALIIAQATSDLAGQPPSARTTNASEDKIVDHYKNMYEVMVRPNPLGIILPRFVQNIHNNLFRLGNVGVEEIRTENGRYTISRTKGIIGPNGPVTVASMTEMLTPTQPNGTRLNPSQLKANASEAWNMIKEVSDAFQQATSARGKRSKNKYGFRPSIISIGEGMQIARAHLDRVLRDPSGQPVRGRYEDMARVLLNDTPMAHLAFASFNAKARSLGLGTMDLGTFDRGSKALFPSTATLAPNTAQPASYNELPYAKVTERHPLNMIGLTYLTPDMQETVLNALRGKEAAEATHRVMPMQADEEINLGQLDLSVEDAQQEMYAGIERRRIYLGPKVQMMVQSIDNKAIPGRILKEMSRETREGYAKLARDAKRLHAANPGLLGEDLIAEITETAANIEDSSAAFDYQVDNNTDPEVRRTVKGFWRSTGHVLAALGRTMRKIAPVMTSVAEFSVGGKLGVLQPTRMRTGTERIGPSLTFRVAMPDREQAPFAFDNEVQNLAMFTSHGVMNDPIGGEVFGDIDLAHAYIRQLGEKITTDERAVSDAIERITRELSAIQGTHPEEWSRIGQMLVEELHTGSRFPVRIVIATDAEGRPTWMWQLPDGTLLDSNTDQMPPSELRGMVETHFAGVIDEIAGKEGSGKSRAEAVAQAAHLLKVAMQLRKFIAQNNYQLYRQDSAIKRYQANLPNTTARERRALEKAIAVNEALMRRIGEGEFYFPMAYKAPEINGKTMEQEDAFVDLYVNTASAKSTDENLTPEKIRVIQRNAATEFLRGKLLPHEFQTYEQGLYARPDGEQLAWAKQQMASYLRGSELPLGVTDPQGNMAMMSGGITTSGYDPHTMQRMVDVGALMDPANADRITLERPATEYLNENVAGVVAQTMNDHLAAMLNSAIFAVQKELVDPARALPPYERVARNWDRWINGVFKQKNFTQKIRYDQLITGEDVLADIVETTDGRDKRAKVRLKFVGRDRSTGRVRYTFGATVDGKPAIVHIDGAGNVSIEGKKDGTFRAEDLRTWVRDQGRWMEALARRNPERWGWTYLRAAPYWKWFWDVSSTLMGVSKLGFNPSSAINNTLYQLKTTAWAIGMPRLGSIDTLLKTNDPSLRKEIMKVLYALPTYNWQFVSAKAAEGTVYRKSSWQMMMRSVQLHEQAKRAAVGEAARRGLEGLSREIFIGQYTFDTWSKSMAKEGSTLFEQVTEYMGSVPQRAKRAGRNLADVGRVVAQLGEQDVRHEVWNEFMNVAYKMFQLTEQLNRSIATTTAWIATRGWQGQSYQIGESDEREVGGMKFLVSPGGLTFQDLPASMRQRILRSQAIYVRSLDEAVNYDYANVMRPAWLRQPLANIAFKFGVFTMASYVHRTREAARLVRNRNTMYTKQGKPFKSALGQTVDRRIAFDPSMVTEAEWIEIMRKIAPMAQSEEQMAAVKADVISYLKENGVLLHDSQLNPAWRAVKFFLFSLIDRITNFYFGYQFLMSEPVTVFGNALINLMAALVGFGDDDDDITNADPVVRESKNLQIRGWLNDIARNSPLPTGVAVSKAIETGLKYAVLSHVEGPRNYLLELTKEERELMRNPGMRSFSNLLAIHLPFIKQWAEGGALLAGQEGLFGEARNLGEWAGRMVDIGDRDIMGKKVESEREAVMKAINTKAMKDDTGWNAYKQQARANVMKFKNAMGAGDDKVFRSGAAGGAYKALFVSEEEDALAPSTNEMVWLERTRLGEDKAQEKLVNYYANRLKDRALKKGVPTTDDLDDFMSTAEAQADRRMAQWETLMRQLKIGTDLTGVDEVENYISSK